MQADWWVIRSTSLPNHLPVHKMVGVFMCEHCKSMQHQLDVASDHISSLLDTISIGTGSDHEVSEPMIVGGTSGVYTCVSPFLYASQWRVDTAVSGASFSSILVSSSAKLIASVPDLTGASGVTYSGLSPLDGMLIVVPANNTIPVQSEWYDIRNSENILFVVVSNGANAAYVNIVFRRKRK